MDPHANLRRQRELAREIIDQTNANSEAFSRLDHPEHNLDDNAAELAEHVLALDDWRLSGGFDPYANTAKRT